MSQRESLSGDYRKMITPRTQLRLYREENVRLIARNQLLETYVSAAHMQIVEKLEPKFDSLTPQQRKLTALLVRAYPHYVPIDSLIYFGYNGNLTQLGALRQEVARIRRKMGRQFIIHSLGEGYRLGIIGDQEIIGAT